MEHMYLIYKVGETQWKPHFDIDVDKLNDFITILLISEHIYIQIHPVFWENTADVQNIAISPLMSRSMFDEIMQNLHLEDNSTLDPNDKLNKARL